MKEQQAVAPTQNLAHQQKIAEHPPLYYSISQAYSIRKESINNSNDLIYKKLSKQFQRIKKLRAESNGNSIIAAQHDYDGSSIKRDFKRLHQSYNLATKANVIVKRRIDKMRNKVDHIKSQLEKDELNSVKEVDISKLIGSNKPPSNPAPNGIVQGSKPKI